jgi:hypothetical protein
MPRTRTSGGNIDERTPRWVRAFAVAAVVVVLLVIVLLVTGHGPRRHMHGMGDPTGALLGSTSDGRVALRVTAP